MCGGQEMIYKKLPRNIVNFSLDEYMYKSVSGVINSLYNNHSMCRGSHTLKVLFYLTNIYIYIMVIKKNLLKMQIFVLTKIEVPYGYILKKEDQHQFLNCHYVITFSMYNDQHAWPSWRQMSWCLSGAKVSARAFLTPVVYYVMKTHVRGFFDTDLHEVSWHFATRVGSKFKWPSEDQCQRSHSKWVFVFIPHLKSKYNQLIVSKLSRKSAICPRRSPWRLIVLVRSLRSARLDTAWLVKSVTYFNLIG